MKRSEKEAEIRKLLETPGAVVLLPDGMSVLDAVSMPINELVNRLVYEATPEGGWEPEGLPHRLQVRFTLGPYIVPVGRLWDGVDDQADGLQAAVDAYNAMKEAEEAEADPNDPLTVALERVATEEVAKLVEDAVEVAREEALKEGAEKCVSRYTREEFIAAEIQTALDCRNEDQEDVDPDAYAAIRRRALWYAQAAERAGVIWRRTAPVCECRLCKERRDGKQAQEKVEVEVEQRRQAEEEAVLSAHNEAWIHYCDSGLVANHRMPRETFNAGFDYGYQAGWRARMDTLNPVVSPETVNEMVDGAVDEEASETAAADTTAANELPASDLERNIQSLEFNLQNLLEAINHTNSELHRQSGRISELVGRNADEHMELCTRITELEKAVGAELNSLSEKLHAVERAVRKQSPQKSSLSIERELPADPNCSICRGRGRVVLHPSTYAGDARTTVEPCRCTKKQETE